MQKAYLLALYELAQSNPDVVLLLADSGTSYDELIRSSMPDQVYDFGIGEENMVAAAAGMASAGLIPFVFTAGAFLAYRSMEFIRDDVCLQQMNVKLVGMGTGFGWSTLGPTHHTTEDLSILRAMPGLTILTPCDPAETAACIQLAYKIKGPVYIRIGMGGEKPLYETNPVVESGRFNTLRDGSDVTVFAAGVILGEVLAAAELLSEHGVSVKVIDACSLKPADELCIFEEAKAGRLLVTVEEHSITGGLGSAVLETLSDYGASQKVLRIGVDNQFAKGYGTYSEVIRANALDAFSICSKVLAELEKKKWQPQGERYEETQQRC